MPSGTSRTADDISQPRSRLKPSACVSRANGRARGNDAAETRATEARRDNIAVEDRRTGKQESFRVWLSPFIIRETACFTTIERQNSHRALLKRSWALVEGNS